MAIPLLSEPPRIVDPGGVLRVGHTSVTLETVIRAFQQGSTPEDIVDQYPTLTLADVYDVIAYYLRHRKDVDEYLDARERSYRETTAELKRLSPANPLEARLRRQGRN